MHRQWRASLVSWISVGFVLITQRGWALDPQDFAVLVSAQVQSTPAQIHLNWPAGSSFISGYTVSRKLIEDTSWTPLANLPGAATGFIDTTVVLGAAYEYEIAATSTDGLVAYGYVYSGTEVPFPAFRGRVILIVDATFSSDLANELARLQSDLTGDGWFVLRHDVSRTSSPSDVKSLIQADYNADPVNTLSVFLFGHVPVPYSGNLNPDMHPAHLGAWPADVFYGNMNGSWTDSTVTSTTAEDPRNYNVPGDGKFDQSDIPGPVVLQVGRVDLTDLPAFAPRSELDLLRQYLTKNHNYRQGLYGAARRGLIRDNFGDINGDAPATDAWRAFAPLFGTDNIQVIGPGEFFSTLAGSSYLFAYGGGGGEYYQADGVGSTTDFANQSPQAIFLMLHGSFFGDWDSSDNFLRAALASSGYGVAAAWCGLPHWYFHHMALGETIGRTTLIVQNNRGLYKNQQNLSAGQVHIALMGDPTLRLHVVGPPANLNASSAGSQVVNVSWDPSSDSVRGYYVYRADNPAGPFARLTRSFLTGTSYTDPAAPPGPKVYMVRAVKLESTPSGSYYNPSQGVFATVDAGAGNALPVISIEAVNPTAQEAGAVEGDFVITRAGPSENGLTVSFTIGGTAVNGVDYQNISSSIVLPQGATSAWIAIKPIPDQAVEGSETVTVTLLPNPAYLTGSAATATVNILDNPVNHPPSIAPVPDQTTPANTPTASIPLTISDAETPADSLTLSASSSNTALAPNEGLALGGTGGNRTLIITPATDQSGTATITVTVSDGTASSSIQFQLTVSKVNHAPTAAPDTFATAPGSTLLIKTTDLLANDSDPDAGDSIQIVSVSSPSAAGGTVSLDATTVTYQPPVSFSGTDSFTYTIQDSAGLSATTTVQVNVGPAGSIRSITRGANGQTTIQFVGISGRGYVIQTSKDFSTWKAVGSGVFPTNALATYVDVEPQSVVYSFYRIQSQ